MNDVSSTSKRLLATSRPRQPYPGLRPFEMEEWSIFFGRERMIDDVVELLARQRLVVVHGSSGSGKSSLIRAGVLPRLARQHLRHGVPWRTCAMRPSGGPLWNLAAALADMEGKSGDIARVDEIRRAFDRPAARLDHIVRDVLGVEGQRTCILVDQFEELFRYARETSRDESQLFIELLGGLLADDGEGGVHAVVTMRSEFLGECARYDGLAEAINRTQYLLPRMDRTGLLRAIRRPAEVYGGAVEADLAERLIAEAGGGQDALPLIQHALMLLWRQASAAAKGPPRLDLALYRRHEGGIAALLSDHADQVLAEAAPDAARQKVAERLFRALTDLNVEGQGIRRPQRFDRLVAVTGTDRETLLGLIDVFRAEGVSFLTPYPPKEITDSDVIDISHEALIRCWSRVADPNDGWLQREFQDGLIWRSLLVHAEGFERNRKDVLSPALTEERGRWMEGRPPAWSERYDGGWQRVADLIRASEAAAARIRRREAWRRRVSWAPLVVLAAVGVWMAGESWHRQVAGVCSGTKSGNRRSPRRWRARRRTPCGNGTRRMPGDGGRARDRSHSKWALPIQIGRGKRRKAPASGTL